jgi:hypothetical protein
MWREEGKRDPKILGALTRLDLYHHSLKLLGDKLIASVAQAEPSGLTPELEQRSLEVGGEFAELLAAVTAFAEGEERAEVQSALGLIEVALGRATKTTDDTLHMVNVWRIVQVGDQLLSTLARTYGYERLTGDSLATSSDDRGREPAELARLFAEYGDAMGGEPSLAVSTLPPFEHGILQWRGSQLYYVQRVEDGARWVELDPDVEPRVIAEEHGGVEIAEARTSEGYPLNLMLDVELDEKAVGEYLTSQKGREYFVSGYQVAAEIGPRGRRPERGRR